MGRSAENFREVLDKNAILVAGESSYIDIAKGAHPVHVAIIFDVTSYGPHTAAIYAHQGRGGDDHAFQEAYELLEEWMREHQSDVLRELEAEYGERADEVFMENAQGESWTLEPEEFGKAIKGTDASKFIEVYNSKEERFDPRDETLQKRLLTAFDERILIQKVARDLFDFALDEDDEKEVIRAAKPWFEEFWQGTPMKWSKYERWLEAVIEATR
jgi:ferredoxin-NADP reductase